MEETLNIRSGDALPPFELSAHMPGRGTLQFSSADWQGRPVVLFFYPAADTPG